MTSQPANLSASVAARLLNHARAAGEDYQAILTTYCFERFLFRLGKSAVRERFVLKGAMLLRVWSDHPYRATIDLDLLRTGPDSIAAVRADVHSVCTAPVEPDGVAFDPDRARIRSIREGTDDAGTRVILPVRCGTARLLLQIDIGAGDAVWPAPEECVYPALLNFPQPSVLAYPREVVVAEKLHAMVMHGDRNSRIKDFFDVRYLAMSFAFDQITLGESVRRTFRARQTGIPELPPIALTGDYWANPSRPAQLRAFARRARLDVGAGSDAEAFAVLGAFLLPILHDVRTGLGEDGTWPPGGPWGSR